MTAIVTYLVKNILVSGILLSLYWLVLRNRKMHNYNRFFLLQLAFCSIVLPLCHFQLFSVAPTSMAAMPVGRFILQAVRDNSAPGVAAANFRETGIDWAIVVNSLYCLISAAFFVSILIRVLHLFRLARRHKTERTYGAFIVSTGLQQAPFSFFNYIFWRDSIPVDSPEGQTILRHELVHVLQNHTYDKLALQLVTSILWINPFYWLLSKELSMVHEYIADEQAVPHNDPDTFARMLLQTSYSGKLLLPEHHFFSSPIKRRLTMLKTNKTRYTLLRSIAVLPVLVALLVLFSFTSRTASPVKAAKKIILVVDAGHGGMDHGASFADFQEKDLNLRVAKRLRDLSPEYNIETHLTRSDDQCPSLAQRVEYSNGIHPDAFVSVHVNGSRSKTDTGNFDVVINMDNKQAQNSRKLGWNVYQQLHNTGYKLAADHLSNERIYVCSHNNAPAILLELGCMQRTSDVAKLTDDAKLNEICNAILRGVVESNKSDKS